MTTIAYRDGAMVGDSAVFDRGTYCGMVTKVFRNEEGWLLGCAGALGDMAQYRDWFLGGREGEAPAINEDDCEFLMVDPQGKAFWFGKSGRNVEIAGAFFSIGSGFKVAMGALSAGASAWDAIEIAANLDCYTRGPLFVVRHG